MARSGHLRPSRESDKAEDYPADPVVARLLRSPPVSVFEALAGEYEQVVFGHDPQVGLRTIVAVYSTARGPALGGTRIFPYVSEDAALADVLRLGKAMAYKAACADLALGGGK